VGSAVLAAVALGACGGGSDGQAQADREREASVEALVERYENTPPLVVNIYVDDTGYVPSIFSVPAGRPVQLIMRNRGRDTHGFQVTGLDILDSIWFVREPGAIGVEPENFSSLLDSDRPVVDVDNRAFLDEHEAHHTMGFMAPRFACPEAPDSCGVDGVISTEFEPAEVRVIMFTPVVVGTFAFTDPAGEAAAGSVIVF
jgi:hypothetical protein